MVASFLEELSQNRCFWVSVKLKKHGSLLRCSWLRFVIEPRALITMGTTDVLAFHILFIFISRSLYLLNFSASLTAMFILYGIMTSINRHSLVFLSWDTISGLFASIVRSVIIGKSHINTVLFCSMTLFGWCSHHLSLTCTLSYFRSTYVATRLCLSRYCLPAKMGQPDICDLCALYIEGTFTI